MSARSSWVTGCWSRWLIRIIAEVGAVTWPTRILGLPLCSVVTGPRSLTAIAEWVADADKPTLWVLGSNPVAWPREEACVCHPTVYSTG